jgi:hypothetical protein
MDRLLTWIRDNPQAAAVGVGLAITTLVIAVLAFSMHRTGASLRPIVWFAGFMAVIGGPQAVVHLLDHFASRRVPARQVSARQLPPPHEGIAADASRLSPVPWIEVFGPKADPALIVDAKRGLEAILHEALDAKLSFNADGDSALAARFPSAQTAAEALNLYGKFFAFQKAHGSDEAGWTAWRSIGDWAHVVAVQTELYVWTSKSRQAVIANRERALGPLPERAEAAHAARLREAHARAAGIGPSFSGRLRASTPAMVAFLVINLVAAVFWFFKGSAWAARIEGAPVAWPAAEETLRRDLIAVNSRDVPTEVTQRADGTIEINWRYADARWFDLMRVHQMKRAHRLVLSLDERSHTVRVTDYMSAFDASASPSDLRLNWKTASGIQFFDMSHQRVFGAQLGPDGKPTGDMSKAYTFDLQALKGPVIDAVTQAGWRWQPVAWNAPAWLRWLTE